MKDKGQNMKHLGWMLLPIFLLAGHLSVSAQQYTGMTGLIHTPSAEMNEAGTVRIGGHFLNREFTPDGGFDFGGKYHTADYYLSLTPFPWMELAYTCTLQKGYHRDGNANIIHDGKTRYYYQDRYFSVKLRPLKEGEWWPAIAIGTNDPIGTHGDKGTVHEGETPAKGDGKSQYFSNYYVAATKHFGFKAGELGIHIACRKFKRAYNSHWNGVVGGATFRPAFARNMRAIVEYTGEDINVGADCLLWKHLLVQASLQNGKYLSGGVCFQMSLF